MKIRSRLLLSFGLGISIFAPRLCASTLSHGIVVQVQVEHDTPMKVGQPIRAALVYPLYMDNRMVLSAGTVVLGHITALGPAPKHDRLNARLGGDFTPLHKAQLIFDELALPGGRKMRINAPSSGEGVEVVRFAAAGSEHEPSLLKRVWARAIGQGKQTVGNFTAPGKMERAKRMLYSELPYHPQMLLAGTQYTVTFEKDLELSGGANESVPQPKKGIDTTVKLAAALTTPVSSKDAVPGTKVTATVTEPTFDSKHQLLIPQGSLLEGEVTQAHPAGKWGRSGTLRFSFQKLQFPAGFTQHVRGSAASVDADKNANLAVDVEGGVRPKPKGIAAPLAMGLLAASAVNEDEATVLHTGGASNGFALIGRAAALATNSVYVAAGIGFYGTARSVYSRYIAHGDDVTFPQNTRIEVVLGPEGANVLRTGTPLK